MGDGLKLAKDKRHRSSSSLAGAGVEGTRSERKLDIRALIPEVDDHFATAETRCDDLLEKIDLVKVLKRKRNLIKEELSQQATRMRRLEVPQNPTRGYLDPATVEQHRMLGQVWGYGHNYNQGTEYPPEPKTYSRKRGRQTRADGDGMYGQGRKTPDSLTEGACGQDEDILENADLFDECAEEFAEAVEKPKQTDNRIQGKTITAKKKHYMRDNNLKDVPKWIDSTMENARGPGKATSPLQHRRRHANIRQRQQQPQQQQQNTAQRRTMEDQSVVELFNKSRTTPQQQQQSRLRLSPSTLDRPPTTRPLTAPKKEEKETKRPRDVQKSDDHTTVHSKEGFNYTVPRRLRYRSHRYELPTVASQMKQADIRYHCAIAKRTNIPFVVSKSTAPSHNIGVNIQQVLNGLKVKQPLNGIPLTIAHHMGLGHVSMFGTKSVTTQPSLNNREINAIKLGGRLLLLPSYKYISYNRLLKLYREGDGMVPRFLRAISRPHYFYTSMYNLATNREVPDGGITKRSIGGHETKRELAEYSSLYREYEEVERSLKEGGATLEGERRRDYLLRELATREEHIRKLVQNPSTTEVPVDFNLMNLHASTTMANEGHRHTFKLNAGDQ